MPRARLRILLAEDNEDDLLLIREALEEIPLVQVMRVVRDGKEALEALRGNGVNGRKEVDLVVLDINMPKKNGFDVLTEMKRDAKLRQIPVVMLTVSEREEDIVKAYSEGACTYIRKPVTFAGLQQVVKALSLYWSSVAMVPSVE